MSVLLKVLFVQCIPEESLADAGGVWSTRFHEMHLDEYLFIHLSKFDVQCELRGVKAHRGIYCHLIFFLTFIDDMFLNNNSLYDNVMCMDICVKLQRRGAKWSKLWRLRSTLGRPPGLLCAGEVRTAGNGAYHIGAKTN